MLCFQRLCGTFLVLLGQIFASDADALGCKTCEVDFGRLDYRLRATAVVNAIFPEADEISLPTGEPPVATVYRDGEVIGYLYATYETVGASVQIGLKDANLALEAGETANVPLPSLNIWRDRLLGAIAHGDGECDWAVMAREQARASGLE